MLSSKIRDQFTHILKEELIAASGCTEPIAIAYAGAVARRELGSLPDKIKISCSGNIVKNAQGVIVPNSGGQKGIEIALALGLFAGKAERQLEVLQDISPDEITGAKKYLEETGCEVGIIPGSPGFHIKLEVMGGSDSVLVEIRYAHTNIIRIEKNGVPSFVNDNSLSSGPEYEYDELNIKNILIYANEVPLSEVEDIIARQIECNTSISEEGLRGSYGQNVGRNLISVWGEDIKIRAKAKAAAGSDARMGGSCLPVVINSGSGNQGLTVSLPVLEYAAELGSTKEQLYRALILSNLVSIHIKKGIGVLSAFCGAVSAACGSGAGIAYLHGAELALICNTIINTLANVSGIICDGAKASCAAKISSSVDAAILGFHMAKNGNVFSAGEGIVKEDIEDLIVGIAKIGREGMYETDINILEVMIGK